MLSNSLVDDIGFEPMTYAVSRRRSTAELIVHLPALFTRLDFFTITGVALSI